MFGRKGAPPKVRDPVYRRALLVHSHVKGDASLLPGKGTVQWPEAAQAHRVLGPSPKVSACLGLTSKGSH